MPTFPVYPFWSPPMDGIAMVVFFIALSVGAYYDWKNRMIPDIVSATIWMTGLMSMFVHPFGFIILPVAFGLLFMLVASYKYVTNNELMGWADVLTIPPWLAMMGAIFFHSGQLAMIPIIGAAIALPLILAYMGKNKVGDSEIPMLCWMWLAYLFSFIF
jgi:hypothetical protein